jgi:lysophospholipase L1-like esterase
MQGNPLTPSGGAGSPGTAGTGSVGAAGTPGAAGTGGGDVAPPSGTALNPPPTAPAAGAGGTGTEEPSDPTAQPTWVGTWVSAQQLTETTNLPPAPGFPNSTLRQVLQVSLGGTSLRMSFSNLFGNAPLTITQAHFARSTGQSAIDPATDTALLFSGSASVTIPAGGSITSDEVTFAVEPLTNLAVTTTFNGTPPSNVTGHPGSRTTSFLQTGNAISAPTLGSAQPVEHWYFLSEVDVLNTSDAKLVVTLGDSITDGRGSTTNQNDRWPNQLGRRLLADAETANVGVLNQGIGGNRILGDGLGPSAASRFERDALTPPGVHWVVVLEGINDLSQNPPPSAQQLIDAYRQMISQARARNIKIYGGTIMPFGSATQFTQAGENVRQAVNTWIRSGEFDGVIDFDQIARDPAQPTRLAANIDGGDGLHPSATGYQLIAGAIDLGLFKE